MRTSSQAGASRAFGFIRSFADVEPMDSLADLESCIALQRLRDRLPSGVELIRSSMVAA